MKGLRLHLVLPMLVVGFSAPARATAAGYRDQAEEVIKLVDAGSAVAVIDWTHAQWLASGRESRSPEKLSAMKVDFKKVLDSLGALHGHVLVEERMVADHLARIDYLIIGEQRALRVSLSFQRGMGAWSFTGWVWGNEEELLDRRR